VSDFFKVEVLRGDEAEQWALRQDLAAAIDKVKTEAIGRHPEKLGVTSFSVGFRVGPSVICQILYSFSITDPKDVRWFIVVASCMNSVDAIHLAASVLSSYIEAVQHSAGVLKAEQVTMELSQKGARHG